MSYNGPGRPPTPPPPGPPPPPHYPYYAAPQRPAGSGHIAAYIIGCVMLAFGAVLYIWVNDAYSKCDSGLGAFAQALSADAAEKCAVVGKIHTLSLLLLAAGGLTVLIGFLVQASRKK
jgi:hypothetical protein